jgi:hypothetical protein
MQNQTTLSKPADAKQESGKGLDGTPCSPSSTLTPDILAKCRQMLAQPPPPRGDHFVSMRVLESLQKEFKPAPNTMSAMIGMQLVAMPNQKADCWMISDPHLAKAYRNGDISEETLKRFYEMVSEIRLS